MIEQLSYDDLKYEIIDKINEIIDRLNKENKQCTNYGQKKEQ